MADETQQLEKEFKAEVLKSTPFGTDSDILDSITDMFSGNEKRSGINDEDDGTELIENEQQLTNALNGKKEANTTSSKPVQQKQAKTDDGEDGKNGDPEEEEDDETDPLEEDEKGEVKIKKDVFNSGKKTTQPVTEKTLLPVLSKTFNINLEEEGGHDKLIKSINKIRTKAQEYDTLNTEVTEYKEFLAGLPQEIKTALIAFNKGEDWKTAFGGQVDVIDYNADFEKIPDDKKLDVVNKLSGGQFKEVKDIPAVTLSAVKNIFATQKQLSERQTEVEKQRTANQKIVFDSALDASVEEFKSENPDFDKVLIRNMAKKLQSGEYRNYFFDKNGNPHKQAMKRLIYSVVAEDRIKQLEEENNSLKGSKKTVDKSNNQSKQPVTKRQPNTKDNVLPKEVEAEVSGLVDLLKSQNLTY